MKSGFLFLLGLLLFPMALQSDDFHVKIRGTGTGMNGWSDAMGSIQGAIDLAAKTPGPDTIHVAGTVGATVNMFDVGGQPTTTPVTVFSNLDFYRENLTLVSDVTILGGYPPNPTTGAKRDPFFHLSVVEGTWAGHDLGRPVTIEGQGPSPSGLIRNVEIDGIVMEHGSIKGMLTDQSRGGGVYIKNARQVTVENCIIRQNQTDGDWGGGIALVETCQDILIKNNVIENNAAFGLQNGRGGGISVYNPDHTSYTVSVQIQGNLITGNFAQANQSGIAADRGGDGIHVSVDSPVSPGGNPQDVRVGPCNNLYGNAEVDLFVDGGTVDARDNYWGMDNANFVASRVEGGGTAQIVPFGSLPCQPMTTFSLTPAAAGEAPIRWLIANPFYPLGGRVDVVVHSEYWPENWGAVLNRPEIVFDESQASLELALTLSLPPVSEEISPGRLAVSWWSAPEVSEDRSPVAELLGQFSVTVEEIQGPQITDQTVSQVTYPGTRAVLSVSASGGRSLSYQWLFNGSAIPGANQPELEIPNVGSRDVGTYSVIVRNETGSLASQPIQVSLVDLRMFAGVVLSGAVGTRYLIEYRDALDSTDEWKEWTTVVLEEPQQAFVDLASSARDKRYYRASVVP